jgi:hypothetical protein
MVLLRNQRRKNCDFGIVRFPVSGNASMLPCLSVVGLAKLASNLTNMCKIHLDSGLQEQEGFHPMVWIFFFLGWTKKVVNCFLMIPNRKIVQSFFLKDFKAGRFPSPRMYSGLRFVGQSNVGLSKLVKGQAKMK